jgi:hypothetical protein
MNPALRERIRAACESVVTHARKLETIDGRFLVARQDEWFIMTDTLTDNGHSIASDPRITSTARLISHVEGFVENVSKGR